MFAQSLAPLPVLRRRRKKPPRKLIKRLKILPGHQICPQNIFFKELSVNESKPDEFNFPSMKQNFFKKSKEKALGTNCVLGFK